MRRNNFERIPPFDNGQMSSGQETHRVDHQSQPQPQPQPQPFQEGTSLNRTFSPHIAASATFDATPQDMQRRSSQSARSRILGAVQGGAVAQATSTTFMSKEEEVGRRIIHKMDIAQNEGNVLYAPLFKARYAAHWSDDYFGGYASSDFFEKKGR